MTMCIYTVVIYLFTHLFIYLFIYTKFNHAHSFSDNQS